MNFMMNLKKYLLLRMLELIQLCLLPHPPWFSVVRTPNYRKRTPSFKYSIAEKYTFCSFFYIFAR